MQAGDSGEGREFAASSADAIFSRHSTLDAAQAFYRDVKGRLAKYGRSPDELKILPAATFVLGDTEADAEERAREIRLQQVSPATAIKSSNSSRTVTCPTTTPTARCRPSTRRAKASAEDLTTRELIIEVTGRQSFVGTAASVAETIDSFVQQDASDGFVLVPHITPGGMDEFADSVVPLLQERGSFRADYEGTTLREHLGLASLPAANRTRVAS